MKANEGCGVTIYRKIIGILLFTALGGHTSYLQSESGKILGIESKSDDKDTLLAAIEKCKYALEQVRVEEEELSSLDGGYIGNLAKTIEELKAFEDLALSSGNPDILEEFYKILEIVETKHKQVRTKHKRIGLMG